MSSNSIIVQEYLGSLKEDKELDYLFPLLLGVMGFRIIQTAKDSKGQSQYGKDIIAVGNDSNDIKYRWYFELKGYSDRNITQSNFFSPDGIRESILEAVDTDFSDASIQGFNSLPIKIVVVHNGVIKANIRPTFDGFISKTFKGNEGQFERWDIYHLTELFSKHLFSEYLLADKESNRLFKRTLAFLDAPDYNLLDFEELAEIQFSKVSSIKGRDFEKLFASLNLLLSIIFHYSKDNDNLSPAKKCSNFLVLRTWSWILKMNFESEKRVISKFENLLEIQYEIFNEYIHKTINIASQENGLYSEKGRFFEAIGFPSRCFEYISDVIYYSELQCGLSKIKNHNDCLIRNNQKDKIINLIEANSGFKRPLLDNHSIPILQVFLFFVDDKDLRQKDINFITSFIFELINGLIVTKVQRGRFPEGYNRIELVSEYVSSSERPEDYVDESSMLIPMLLELLVIFDAKGVYLNLKKHLREVSLQMPYPKVAEFDIEESLFEKHMDAEYYVETSFELPDDFEEYKKTVKAKPFEIIDYKTDKLGFSFLRTLAHSYFKNEIFPNEWRKYFID